MALGPKAVAIVLLIAGSAVVIGTGAFSAVSAERTASVSVAGDSSALLQLQPHGENSGATLVDGQLKIGELNIDATTDYGDGVFKITNQGTQPVGVWITDRDEDGTNYTNKVTFYNDTFGGYAGVSSGSSSLACENGVKSIESKANAVQLGVGETLVVDLKIVTEGVTGAQTSVLTGMIIHADATVTGATEKTDSVVCTGDGDDSGGSGGQNNVDLVRDTDGDIMDDKTEEAVGLDPNDADTDGDGINDTAETTKLNGNGPGYEIDTDNDGLIDANDTDADGDGINDSVEGTGDADDDGIPNYRDLDSDGDGINDSVEGTADDDNDDVPNYLDAQNGPITVEIEVKPDDDDEPDPISLNKVENSNGKIPVAIYTTDEFNVTTINVSSLRFGAPSAVDNGNGAHIFHTTPLEDSDEDHFEDIDDDGDLDLVVHFPASDTGFNASDTEAKLVGKTTDGTEISGNESITIVGNGQPEGEGEGEED